MLRHSLGLEAEAASIEKAVERVLSDGLRTADIARGGDSIGTVAMADAVINSIK